MSSEQKKAGLLKAVQQAGSRYGARFMMVHQAIADRLGLNIIDLRCLRLAREAGEPTAGHLAKVTGLTTGTITGVLDRLEKARFIRRERVTDDRRKVTVKVLPGGVREIEKIMEPLSQDMHKSLDEFTEDELNIVLRFFELTGAAVARHIERMNDESRTKRRSARRASTAA